MSSPLSDALEDTTKKASQEVAKQIAQRLDIALGELQKEIENKLKQVIETDMLDYYYGAYHPVRYHRVNELKDNLVEYFIDPYNNGKRKGFKFGIEYFPENMHHTKIRGPRATKDPIPVDEALVAENFSEGIHPNGVPEGGIFNQGPIWTMDDDPSGSAAQIMSQWVEANKDRIFNEALSKIMKKL